MGKWEYVRTVLKTKINLQIHLQSTECLFKGTQYACIDKEDYLKGSHLRVFKSSKSLVKLTKPNLSNFSLNVLILYTNLT